MGSLTTGADLKHIERLDAHSEYHNHELLRILPLSKYHD